MTQGVVARLWPSVVDVWNPIVPWREIEPRPGEFRFGPIRDLVQKARASGDFLRLRVYAGRMAPDWVRNRFGSVRVVDPIDGMSAYVPRWWVPGYMDRYAHLQARLARAFDGNRTIKAVMISGAMTIYAEPFIRGIQSSQTRQNLLATSYTARKDRRALMRSVAAHRAWHRTRQVLTVNPWQYINQDGSFGFSVGFTNKVMHRARRLFRHRAILQNNSMRSSWLTDHMPGGYTELFSDMRRLGPPISFQTANTSRVGNLKMVLDWMLWMGAHGVEMKPGAVDQLTYREAQAYDTKFERN